MQILIQPDKSVGWEGKRSSLKSFYLCEAVQNIMKCVRLEVLMMMTVKFNFWHDGIPI